LKNKEEINHHLIIICLDIREKKNQQIKQDMKNKKKKKQMKFLTNQRDRICVDITSS